MQKVTVKDKEFSLYITREEIDLIVKDLANKINNDFKDKEIHFVSVLNGAFMFASDLLKEIKGNHKIDFVRIASYDGMSSSGDCKKIFGITENIEGKDIVIIEDIIDSGFSMKKVLDMLYSCKPASVTICTFVFKPSCFEGDYEVKYIGKNISEEFIVGYGLDYDGYGRNLPHIYQLV